MPIGLLFVWLFIIGLLVWQHVCDSHQPPLYDALSYLLKAKSFWENVSQGWVQNPLNLVQPARPPGTVLLSYPLGFTHDYRGFLFRTVFVPFVIWVIALLITSWPMKVGRNRQSYWPAIFTVFLLGPMPLFFQFEYPTYAYWGMMDGFLASLAALAIACAGRSLMQKSFFWVLSATLFAAFCPLIKPSGSLVLVLTTAFWSGGAFMRILNSDIQERTKTIRFWLFGTSMFIVFGGSISWMCLNSKYLSPEIVSFFKQAMVILQSESDRPFTFHFIKSTTNSLFGPQFFIFVFATLFISRLKINNFRFQVSNWIFLTASLLIILVGGWFWVFASGVSQPRYFYPFALMFIIPIVFVCFRKLYAMGFGLHTFFLRSLSIVTVLPALNLILLLLVQNPNQQWQNFSGVSMNVKSGKSGVEIAKELQKELNTKNKSAVVYSIGNGIEIISFNCYGWYQNIINPELRSFSTRTPIDWQRPSTYRISEILETDYIIFKPIFELEQDLAFTKKKINSLDEESTVFGAFLSSLTPENGLVTKYENQDCRLSLITDKEKLKEAFYIFKKTKSWRPVFCKENEIASELALTSISRKVNLEIKESTEKVNYSFGIVDISERTLKIIGWGFLEGFNSDSLESYILFKKNEQIIAYNTITQIRKDLTTGFSKTGLNLDSAGFQIKIPIQNFDAGSYNLGLYIVKGNKAGIFFSDKFVNIESIPNTSEHNN